MRWLAKLSIGQRLAAGFSLVIGVSLVLLMAMQRWQARSAEAERFYLGRVLPRQETARQLEQATLTVAIDFRTYLLSPTPERYRELQESIREARALLARLATIPREPDGEALFRELERRSLRYFGERERLVALDASARVAEAQEALIANDREAALAALRAFGELQQTKAQSAVTAMEQAREAMVRGTRAAAAAGFLILLVIAFVIARSIQRPVESLVEIADALRLGDWKPALDLVARPGNGAAEPAPRDEMQRLAAALGSAAEALERREARLRADHDVASAAASTLQLDEIAELALRMVADHVNAEVGVLYVASEDAGSLHPVARRSLDGELAPLAVGEGLPGRAAAERRVVITRDLPADTPFRVRLGYDQAPPRAVAAVPLMFRRDVLGVMVLASLRDFDDYTLTFLQSAGTQIGVGLQNVKSYAHVERLLIEVEERSHLIQAQNEELQAQGEEIQAQNEELQAQGEELRTQNDQLSEQADRLREQTEALVRADEHKNEFLGILAHELRNPVAALSNSLHVLRHSGGRGDHAVRAREIMDRQTRQLTRLIDDLLDVTRISRGKIVLKREPVDLVQVVSDCIEDQRSLFESAQVELTAILPNHPVMLDADRSRIAQVFGNLLDNAVKFSGRGARVEVVVEVHGAPQEVVLRVADTGIGIDPAMLPRLFEPFSQAASTPERLNAGLGLGLALVKALIELHGGSVEARSEGPGRGAQFIARLPVEGGDGASAKASPSRKTRKRSATAKASTPRRVLIIEDNADAAQSLRDALEFEGHEVHVARRAQEGLALALTLRPDVVLCDIGLPELDGYEIASRLRADKRFGDTLLVAISGYASPVDAERARLAGFDRHLAKPASIERLNEVLATVGSRLPA